MKTRFTEKSPARRRKPVPLKPSLKSGEGYKIERLITIDRPVHEVYGFWRRFENLPRFMRHIESVTETNDGLSHWVLRTDRGKRLEWDSRIIEEKPNQMISWQSLEGADVDNAGSVWFTPAPGGRGTVVKVSMKYSPPGGKIGALLAKVFGEDAEEDLAEDLRELKNVLENL